MWQKIFTFENSEGCIHMVYSAFYPVECRSVEQASESADEVKISFFNNSKIKLLETH